jgi:hypothetical protein
VTDIALRDEPGHAARPRWPVPRIDQDAGGTVWVGGDTVTYVDGQIEI